MGYDVTGHLDDRTATVGVLPKLVVQVAIGPRTEPNIRATELPLSEGLVARSQNCWSSVGFDVGEVNNLLSLFFPARFYYKTFIVTKGTRAL